MHGDPIPGGQRRGEGGARRYAVAIKRNALLIVALVVAAMIAAAIYVEVTPNRYQAESDLLVTPVAEQDPAYVGVDVLRDSGTPGTSVVTAATLATSAGVVDLAAHKLGLPAATVGAAVQAQPVTQSDIVSVTAQQESSAPRAADIANALAAAV